MQVNGNQCIRAFVVETLRDTTDFMSPRIPPRITLHRILVQRDSSTTRTRMNLSYTKGQANDKYTLICSRRPCQVSLQSQAATFNSSSAAFRISKIPTTRLNFPDLSLALLQMICSYCGVSAWRASHSQHYNHTPKLSRSRASIAVTPGSVDGPRSTSKRETGCYYVRHRR